MVLKVHQMRRVCCGVICWGIFSRGGWVICMGRNARVDVCSHVCIWIEYLIFCLAGCFLMGD